MKKFFLFLFFLQLLFSPSLFAQIIKIVDVEGDVSVRRQKSLPWQTAAAEMYLGRRSELKTGRGSKCTITLDEELENILAIKENSFINIEDITPGKIFMPQGRVFSLIDDITKLQEFQIRTPTVIAGVRGTGESVDSKEDGSTVKCFQGRVYVQGVDKEGDKSGKAVLSEGFGVGVGPHGEIGDIFGLSVDDYEQWSDFRSDVGNIRAGAELKDTEGMEDTGNLDDLLEERQQNYGESVFEDAREDEEGSGSSGGNGQGNGGEVEE